MASELSILTVYAKADAPRETLRSQGACKIAVPCFDLPRPAELEGAHALLVRAPDLDVNSLDRALGDRELEVIVDTSGAWSFAAAAVLTALRQKRTKLRGCFGADPLRAYARGLPLDWDRPASLFGGRSFNVLRHSTSPYSDAGAALPDQLAFVLATSIDSMRRLDDRGIAPETVAQHTTLQFELDCDQFLGIALLRAARACWARIADVLGFDVPARIHAETARRVLTVRDPWVNLLRGTITCFSAIVGGADWVTTAPFDAAGGLPSEIARRLAKNTGLLLREEAHLDHVVDPAGGSWYLERLTRTVAETAWTTFQEIERLGGMQAVLTSGWIDRRIDASRRAAQAEVATRKLPITGVSEFPDLSERRLTQAPYRSPGRIEAPELADLSSAIEAAGKGVSLAAIASAVHPSGLQRKRLPVIRWAEPFEVLRHASDVGLELAGERPRIFLANLGPIAEHVARATWTRNLFEAGGIEAVQSEDGNLAEAFRKSGARAAVICSSDRIYGAEAGAAIRALRAAGARPLYLAGPPNAAYSVDRFVHAGMDVLAMLADLHRTLGVPR
jgi:methylmalonyl-CoA mutase